MAVEPTQGEGRMEDFEDHVRDYSGFIKLFTYGAIASLVIAFIVVLIIS